MSLQNHYNRCSIIDSKTISPMRHSINRRQFMEFAAAGCGALLVENLVRSGALGATQEVQVCPKSRPPARVITALRLTELTTDGWGLRLTLSCLQGIVNRSQPRLYLIHDGYD